MGHSSSGQSESLTTASTRQGRNKRGVGSGSAMVFSCSNITSDCTRLEPVLRKITLGFGLRGDNSCNSGGDLNCVGRGPGDGRIGIGDSSEEVRRVIDVMKGPKPT